MTVPFGRVTVGGFVVLEDWTVQQSGDALALTGEQASPPNSAAHVVASHHNLPQLRGRTVPATFTGKSHLDGFYRVADAASELYERGGIVRARWSLSLERVGSSRDVEIESRVPTVGRLTDHAVSPVFWHAPAVGATSYWTGSTVPSGTVTRDSMDGPVMVHTGIPSNVAPRWTVPVEDYLGGSVRLLVAGQRRLGEFTPDAAVWEVNNGLVRLTSPGSDGAIGLACWDGAAWRSDKAYQFTVGGTALASQPETTVLSNAPEEVRVRLSYATSVGRVTADLGLRRGSRFVTGVMKRHSSATLGIVRASAEAATSETGRVRASANDADGNRYVVGSAKTFTANTATGGISKAGVTQLDFFAGHIVGGSSAVAGDLGSDLLAQYLHSASEATRIVRR